MDGNIMDTQTEKTYGVLLDNALDAVFLTNPEGTILYANPAACALFGYTLDGFRALGSGAVMDPTDHRLAEALEQRRRTGRFSGTLRMLRKDRSSLTVELSSADFTDANGELRTSIFVRDIAERKQSEDALRQSEAKFRAVVQNSNDGILFCDANALITYRSPSYSRINGYTDDERVGHNGFETVHPDDLDSVRRSWAEILQHPEMVLKVEYRIRHKNGTWRWIGTTVQNLLANPDIREIVVTSHDITERKQTEEKLRESENKFRSIFEQATDGIMIADAETKRQVEANKSICTMLGYTRDEILSLSVDDIHPKEDLPAIRSLFERQLRGEISLIADVPMLRKDGSVFYADINSTPVTLGGIQCLVGIIHDITERKQAEEALQESEERYRCLVDYSPEPIAVLSEGRFIYINQAGLRLLGAASPANLIGRPILDIIPPETREQFQQRARQTQEQGQQTSLIEQDLLRLDGRRITVEITGIPLTYTGKPAMQILIRDVTERKHAEEERQKLQAQLLQAQKMESIGHLAGGIAHDFNNILAAIVGYGNILQMKMENDDPLRTYMNQILASAERAASLTQSLLAFSRKQVINPKDIDLNESIRKVEKFLTRTIGEDIVLSTSLSDDVVTVFFDPSQIEQVLMNMATNARDAMPKGGRLIIETGREMLDDKYVLTHGFGLFGEYAVLTVSDTGEGMDEETQKKIFEPFFTTKELGRGTGLGLSIVYGIVKQNKGYINVYSEIGKGTTFKIYLPFVKARTEEERHSQVQQPFQGGTETILLAEDNETVRLMNRDVLQEFGYTVIEAADGEEALQKFWKHPDQISLFILDVIMPKKNGKEVFEEARRINQNVKVIFTSGYPADLIQKEGVLKKGLHFLSKPSSPQALLQTVRELLDQ